MIQIKPNQNRFLTVTRQESNFDRACEEAYELALVLVGADHDGYMLNVEGTDRSTDALHVEFVTYRVKDGLAAIEHEYRFSYKVNRCVDDEANES